MSDLVDTMFRELLGRAPSNEDRAAVSRLMIGLPDAIRASPAAVADIILRAEHIRALDDIMQKASWEAQQTIHRDLPQRIDQAAMAALIKLRDQLPVDGSDRIRRLIIAVAGWTAIAVIIAASAGWMTRDYVSDRRQAQHQAAMERAFNNCITAAEGIAMTSRTGVEGMRYDSATYRTQARTCAAEYADRRAGG